MIKKYIHRYLHRFFWFILFIFLSFTVFSQEEDIRLDIIFKIKLDQGNAENAKLTIYNDSIEIKSEKFPKSGRTLLSFDFNKIFKVILQKTGYISKQITVSTHVPQGILSENPVFETLEITIDFYRKYPGIDADIFSIQACGEIAYDKGKDDFIYTDFHFDDEISYDTKQQQKHFTNELEEFNNLLIEADQLVDDGQYSGAIQIYENLLVRFPEIDMVTQREQVFFGTGFEQDFKSVLQRLEIYRTAIKKGNQALAMQDNERALQYFKEAKTARPSDNFAGEKVRELRKIISTETEKQRLKTVNAYRDTLYKAEQAFKDKDYELAIEYYNKAKQVKPDEPFPDKMIERINEIIASELNYKENIQNLNDWYNQKLNLADSLSNEGKYIEAQAEYKKIIRFQKIKQFKVDDPLAREKIIEIEQLLLSRGQAMIDSIERERLYKKFMRDGNISTSLNLYVVAKTSYNYARKYKPADKKVIAKISQIDSILHKKEKDAAELGLKRQKYNSDLSIAEEAFRRKKYKQAIQYFENAHQLFPESFYPVSQLNYIQGLLNEQISIERLQAEKEFLYEKCMQEARDLYDLGRLEETREKYLEAIRIDPDQDLPKKRIKHLDMLITQKKHEEIIKKSVDQSYNSLIFRADEALRKKDFQEAVFFYHHANNLKPREAYPRKKLTEIDNVLSLVTRAERARFERIKAYHHAIELADLAFYREDFEKAKELYTEANEYNSSVSYPMDRIKDIEKIIKDREQLQAEQQQKQKKYKQILQKADALFSQQEYEKARIEYNDALLMFPGNKYPQKKIQEISNIMYKNFTERVLKEKRREVFAQYFTLAETHFSVENYKDALDYYEKALVYTDNVQEIKDKIKKTRQLLEQQNNELARLQSKKQRYDAIIQQAELYFSDSDYEKALTLFEEADTLTQSSYPKQRMEDIQKIITTNNNEHKKSLRIADEAFKNKNYSVAEFYYQKAYDIKKDTYSKTKIEESKAQAKLLQSNLQENEYKLYIEKGDSALMYNKLSIAEFYFKKAISLKDDKYPHEKLEEIDILRFMQVEQKKQQEYNMNIFRAEKALEQKELGVAKFYFNKAHEIRPEEKYPQEKIEEITKLIEAKSNNEKK